MSELDEVRDILIETMARAVFRLAEEQAETVPDREGAQAFRLLAIDVDNQITNFVMAHRRAVG